MTHASKFHPNRSLGRLPEDKSKPKLAFGDFLDTSALPAYPATDTKPATTYPMDHNDYVGCCVVAGFDHALRAIYVQLTGNYTQPSDAELLRWYQSQNPNFTNWDQGGTDADGGMVIAQFLSWAIENVKDADGNPIILGYAKIDHTNPAELRAATYVFEVIITGEDVRQAQMDSKDWTYTPNSPEDGGHCTCSVAYTPGAYDTVTWGEDDYLIEESFMAKGVDEAYGIITRAHYDHPNFRDNFDLAGFAAAYKQITGKDFPVPVTPTPTPPNPTPTPPPNETADAALVKALEAWEPTFWARWTKTGKALIAAGGAWEQAHGYQASE